MVCRFFSIRCYSTSMETADKKKKTEQAVRLGKMIREERNKLQFSQEAFADHIGLHRTYMSSIERGERNLSLGNICRIAKGLELTASELLNKAGL